MAVLTSFSAEGEAFREGMRRFFTEHSPLSASRIPEGDVAGLPEYWRDFASLDLLSIGLAESGAAAATSLADVIPLYLEMGRALAMSPHMASAIIATHVISELASTDDHASLVSDLVSGARVVVPALGEVECPGPLLAYATSAERTQHGWTLSGEKVLVPYAHVASHLLVPARTGDGLTAFLVNTTDLELTYMPNVSRLPLFRVRFDGVVVNDSHRLGEVATAGPAFQKALDRASVLRAAEIAGAGEYLQEICVEYGQSRQQFGTPIGTYQAVQYLCTDIAIATRVTLLLALQAAVRIDNGEPYQRELAATMKFAKRAAGVTVSRAQEVHAGVGFMDEFDLHLFTRRSLYWQSELGDDETSASALIAAYSAAGVDHE